VSSDAHSLDDLARTEYGVSVARKGALTAEHVVNTRDVEGFLAALKRPPS
jgi:histidinol phosphatase-like PHP family hydrolase